MSKRPPTRQGKPRSGTAARRNEATAGAQAEPRHVARPRQGARQRVILAIAAGALAAWLTLLAMMAFV